MLWIKCLIQTKFESIETLINIISGCRLYSNLLSIINLYMACFTVQVWMLFIWKIKTILTRIILSHSLVNYTVLRLKKSVFVLV